MISLTKKERTVSLFYAVAGAGVLFTAICLWKSFLIGWHPLILDFNSEKEGVLELLMMSWAVVYMAIYFFWRIKKDYEAKNND
jgi:hypothetical protein